jgi:hypothetical protein
MKLTQPKKYSGRWFTSVEIDMINELISANPNSNRSKLSKMVCEKFSWYKVNGGLKDMSCRVAMIKMNLDQLIALPAPTQRKKPIRSFLKRTSACDPQPDIFVKIHEIEEINLSLVNKTNSHLWNEYVERYHYLGYKPLPGAQLRYFIFSGKQCLGLFGFGASAWKTAPRDNYIEWNSSVRESNLHLIVNNARFLIFPWVKIPNLASKALSLVTKQIAKEWMSRYHYRPLLLETFVDIERFKGTCYKAANWIYLGETQGRGKKGSNKATLPVKSIWVYPLNKNFKHLLLAG